MPKPTIYFRAQPENSKINYRQELNDEQYQVVTEASGPCLVLAGAGSGKTRTLVYRLIYLLESGVKPNQIMLVTFTNKAAKEMLSRAQALYSLPTKGLWGGTFHSIGNRMLRMYGRHIGISPDFTILDEEDSKILLKLCLSEVSAPKDKYFPKVNVLKKIVSLSTNLSRSVPLVIDDRFDHIDKNYRGLIEEIAEKYQAKKIKTNALDFDDLLFKWERLLLECDEVRIKLANQFKYILVDEYQDTNHLQGSIVNHLAGKEQNVLVVGDDSQSIYSFRGADVNNILTFPEVYPKCSTYKLETNYRSTPEILALANHSIKNNLKQFEKRLQANKQSGRKPTVVAVEDAYRQADFICQRILELVGGGSKLSDIAILFRAHYHSLELELGLNKSNIAYTMRGGIRFFEQAHIKDVTAYLKIVNNIHDEVAWQRILLMQPRIGPAIFKKILNVIFRLSSLAELLAYPLANELGVKPGISWTNLAGLLRQLAKAGSSSVAQLIEIVLRLNYREYLKNNFEDYQDRSDDLEQLVAFSDNYQSLEEFLADVALAEGFKNRAANRQGELEEAVVLSTIHQAKGLEWGTVFVIGLAAGQFPGAQSYGRSSDLEEERRLFYVAATRAKDNLYLLYPIIDSRTGNANQPSEFIRELPRSVYQDWGDNDDYSPTDLNDGDVSYISDENEGSVADEFWKRMRSIKH